MLAGFALSSLFFFFVPLLPAPRPLLLLHLDPEGDAAQELVPLVVVAQVGALHPALHRQLLVVLLLGEQQLHGHQGLHVVLLQSGKGRDGRLVNNVILRRGRRLADMS